MKLVIDDVVVIEKCDENKVKNMLYNMNGVGEYDFNVSNERESDDWDCLNVNELYEELIDGKVVYVEWIDRKDVIVINDEIEYKDNNCISKVEMK